MGGLGGVVSGGVMVARKFAFSSYGVLVSVSKSFTVPASCILTPIPLRPKVVRQSCTLKLVKNKKGSII